MHGIAHPSIHPSLHAYIPACKDICIHTQVHALFNVYIHICGVLQGLSFLNTILCGWSEHRWMMSELDDVCKKWVIFLLKNIDFSSDTVASSLQKFTRCSRPTTAMLERVHINKLVCELKKIRLITYIHTHICLHMHYI